MPAGVKVRRRRPGEGPTLAPEWTTPAGMWTVWPAMRRWSAVDRHLELALDHVDRLCGVGVEVGGEGPAGRRVVDEQAEGAAGVGPVEVDLGPHAAGHEDDLWIGGHRPTIIESMASDYSSLPDDLPVPIDDGAADGLVGRELPDLALPSTGGGELRLPEAAAGLLVAYVYPMTGTPGVPLPEGWDDIPGARGCTPQSCAYRDALAEFRELGAELIGISAQTPAEQAEFAAREHIPYPLLSDDRQQLAAALALPTFEVEGRTLYRRLTFVAVAGRIVKVFYPVFPPTATPPRSSPGSAARSPTAPRREIR